MAALYGVVVGNGHSQGNFALFRSQKVAKAEAKRVDGRVYVMRNEPQSQSWDAPTFIACSHFVAAYAKPTI